LRRPLPEPSGTLLGGANSARPTDRHKRDGAKLDGGPCPSRRRAIGLVERCSTLTASA